MRDEELRRIIDESDAEIRARRPEPEPHYLRPVQADELDPAEELAAAKADPNGRELSPDAQALYEAEGAARFAAMHGGRNRPWEWMDSAPAAPGVAPSPTPLNGIAANGFHGEGAIAQCGYCRRYSLDPKTLGEDRYQPVCECGQKHGWSGSFKKPGQDAKWSGKTPSGVATRHPRCGYPYCACVGECFAASQPGVTAGVATGGALPDPKLCPRCCQYHGPICPAGVREDGRG